MDVIGAGFGRTGTRSLKAALELLGFGPCHHMAHVVAEPRRVRRWLEVGGNWPSTTPRRRSC